MTFDDSPPEVFQAVPERDVAKWAGVVGRNQAASPFCVYYRERMMAGLKKIVDPVMNNMNIARAERGMPIDVHALRGE